MTIFGIDNPARSGHPAVIDADGNRAWTFGELAESLTARRAELGDGKKLLFNFCRNRIDSLLWYLAALDAGHAVALLDDGMDAAFKTNLIAEYRPETIANFGESPGTAYERGSADGLWMRSGGSAEPLHPALGLLLSTSGTTGSPKFVRLTRRNVEANAESITAALGIASEDRAIASLPVHYSYGLSVVNSHLLSGAAVVLTQHGLTSQGFWEAIRRERCTSMAGVPYGYQVLRRLGLDSLNVPSIRTLTQAGGKLDNAHILHFHGLMAARGGRFIVMYGQTEATARISVLPAEELPARVGSVGLPIPGGSFSIVKDGAPVEPGQSGELVYQGPNVMMGYAWNRADLAKGDELQGRLFTGDTGTLDPEGYLTVLGRAGRDAKLFGLRLNLDEIEAMLKRYGPTAVTAAGDHLLIFCEHGDEAAYRRYRLELAEKLKVHHQAFLFRHIDRLPLTSSGKIDYQVLAAAL